MTRSLTSAFNRVIVLDAPLPAYPKVSRAHVRSVMMASSSPGGRLALTPAEVELLRLLATEKPMDAVARTLDISERTLRRHSRALFDKIGVAGRIEAAVWATRNGLL